MYAGRLKDHRLSGSWEFEKIAPYFGGIYRNIEKDVISPGVGLSLSHRPWTSQPCSV